ncbi:PhzF family phenazine biosynthesis protein [Catenuloplanes japonicus]|uniref:PhzF family phenazine biosynthesis protein n=1 Tax=Catenuloplanes japonicus TaxID=33876 RepID=UPI0005260A43|nr:PhzF family phenazine biosynthesis isomerase [Catenuloplanes japonicus]
MEILRYTAFSDDPSGGNPAGVVLDATGATDARMLAVAAEVGYSETAFLFPRADGAHDVRYFSPLAEVPFCGHATIATAVAHADRHGPGTLRLHTRAGLVPVETTGRTATLVSVPPRDTPLDDLDTLLGILGWSRDELDPALPPRVAFAGAWHPVIAARSRERLAKLDYDLDALGRLMAARDWTTIALIWRESATVFHARNPFPPGGVFEDPATGAAAAAFGGYLRTIGLSNTTITIHQGYDMGRPSLLTVSVPADGGISVTGTATPIGG